MAISETDLFCPTCKGYVHPFLEACPACGAARRSHVDDVVGDPDLGIAAVVADPGTQRRITHIINGYALTAPRLNLPRRTGLEGKREPDYAIAEATGMLAGLLPLRAYGCPPTPAAPVDVVLATTTDDLEARGHRDRAVRLRIPLAGILGLAAPPSPSRGLPGWSGVRFGGVTTVRTPAVPTGSLIVTYAADRSFSQLSVQNRPGITSAKARADFYATFGHWLGLTAAAAAEHRWTAIGLRRYLAEIGLGPAVPEEEAAGAGAEAQPSVRAALEALEELRAAGLVAEDEYRRKRAEILARL